MRASLTLAFIVGLLSIAVIALAVTRPSVPEPVPLGQLSNDEFLDQLGITVDVLDGCPIWAGETQGIVTYVYMDPDATEDSVRIVAVCAPETKPVGASN